MADPIARRRRRRSREEWAALFEEYRTSGLTQSAFCHAHGLSASGFRNARMRLAGAGAVAPARAGEFMALEVVDGPRATPSWSVELSLGEGVVLRLRRG